MARVRRTSSQHLTRPAGGPYHRANATDASQVDAFSLHRPAHLFKSADKLGTENGEKVLIGYITGQDLIDILSGRLIIDYITERLAGMQGLNLDGNAGWLENDGCDA
eukprot:scaffold172406_cov19-Prasinocladus_malaysianus.AAC.1